MREQHLHLLALALIRGLGPVTVKNLVATCGSAESVFESAVSLLRRTPGVGDATIRAIRRSDTLARAEAELRFAQRAGVQVFSYLDEAYPHVLKYIHDAPLFLFQKGQLDVNAQPNVAIVGTRRATTYGKEIAQYCAQKLANAGINVVSGLAYGIDIAAHKAVLEIGGKTTAVLAHGLDTVYPPAHAAKAKAMLEEGALLTEYLTGSEPDAMHFPARNRIIAGMSQAIIVIEASDKGGALITADFALQQNREVYAVPGKIGDALSIGCLKLIRDHKAKLMTDPQEVIDDLALQWEAYDKQPEGEQLSLDIPVPEGPLTDEEAKVLNILQKGRADIDQLTIQSRLALNRLHPLLLSMEFKGLIRQLPGKQFERRR